MFFKCLFSRIASRVACDTINQVNCNNGRDDCLGRGGQKLQGRISCILVGVFSPGRGGRRGDLPPHLRGERFITKANFMK